MHGEDLVDFAVGLARSEGAAYSEARYEYHQTEEFVLKNGVLDALFSSEDAGLGVRVLASGGLGFASTNTLTKKSVRDAVRTTLRMAKSAGRREPIAFAEEPSVVSNFSVPEMKKISDISIEDKIETALHIDRDLADTRIKLPARYFVTSTNRIQKYFANSEGSRIRSYSPRVRFVFWLIAASDGETEQTHRNYGWSGGWEAFSEWNAHQRVLEEARSMKDSLEKGRKSPEGKMDLVAGPMVTGIASHESCGHPTEGDRILGREAALAGKSFITPHMVGQKVGSEVVNVVDDPTVEHAIAYYLYDDEGVRARRRYLYKAGRINEFLHNRESAAKLRTRSNGAARATNYDRESIPRMANTFVEPKDYELDEMIEDVKFGIYMKSFTEWNIDDKRFNQKYVGREAYLIENGEIGQPVRKTVLELTTPTFWSAVDAVGKDLEFEAGFCGKSDPQQALDASLGGPHIRLRNVYLR